MGQSFSDAEFDEMVARVMTDGDLYVTPFDYADYTPNPVATLNTSVTNLTGQPCVVVPHGFNEKGRPAASRSSAACSARRACSPRRTPFSICRPFRSAFKPN